MVAQCKKNASAIIIVKIAAKMCKLDGDEEGEEDFGIKIKPAIGNIG